MGRGGCQSFAGACNSTKTGPQQCVAGDSMAHAYQASAVACCTCARTPAKGGLCTSALRRSSSTLTPPSSAPAPCDRPTHARLTHLRHDWSLLVCLGQALHVPRVPVCGGGQQRAQRWRRMFLLNAGAPRPAQQHMRAASSAAPGKWSAVMCSWQCRKVFFVRRNCGIAGKEGGDPPGPREGDGTSPVNPFAPDPLATPSKARNTHPGTFHWGSVKGRGSVRPMVLLVRPVEQQCGLGGKAMPLVKQCQWK